MDDVAVIDAQPRAYRRLAVSLFGPRRRQDSTPEP
jgi:hypothetical protein